MAEGDSYRLVTEYQAGKSEAATAIFERYVDRLVSLARSRLSAKLQRRVDPEDVVQSAFRSFFLHARNEAYVFHQPGDLWRLLVQITLHKLYGQAARHQAMRRTIGREVADEYAAVETASPEPTPVEVVALIEQVHVEFERLSHDQRIAFAERLQGKEIDEIAAAIHRSPRTVRRLLAEVRERIEHRLAGDANAERAKTVATLRTDIERRITLHATDFVLAQMLGAGGMGKVYRAREIATGREVAVKSLRKVHQGDLHAIELFVQEFEILARLRHPNIVGVDGLGRFPGGGLFIVMDYIAGTNLQDELRRGPLGLRRALVVLRDVAGAIAFAHHHGIVHCDLKPANVLVDRESRSIVSDFGFARFLTADVASKRSSIGGTSGFMAPEVYQLGEVPTIAADIYGLGALLWTLAFGRIPDGRAPIHSDDEFRPIVSICRKCLAENPQDRYQSAKELQEKIVLALASAI